MSACLQELELLALADGELGPTAAAEARRHLEGCERCRELAAGLENETSALRAGLAPAASAEETARREFGWVVAAGLALSAGVLGVQQMRSAARDLTDAVPLSDPIPLVSSISRFVISLLDPQSLLTTITQGGIVMLTLIGIAALSSALRRSRGALVPLLAAAAVLPTARPAEALHIIRGDGESASCRVGAEEVIRDDVILLCTSATIAGLVEGDVIFLAQSLDVSGRVAGSLLGAAEVVDISGAVDQSVRVASQRMYVSGTIGRSLMAFGERVNVRPDGSVGGSATTFASNVLIEGPVGGNLRAGGAEIHLDSEIGGEIHTSGGDLAVGPRASAGGAVVHTGAEAPGDSGGLRVDWRPPEEEAEESAGLREPVRRAGMRTLMGTVLGLVLVFLAGPTMRRIAATARRPMVPLLVGAVLAVAVPILSVLVAVTVVGIPLGVTALFAWLFALYASRLVVGLLLGELILGPGSTRLHTLLRLLLGLAILSVAMEIPFVGGLVAIVAIAVGFGAFAVWAFRAWRAPAGVELPAQG